MTIRREKKERKNESSLHSTNFLFHFVNAIGRWDNVKCINVVVRNRTQIVLRFIGNLNRGNRIEMLTYITHNVCVCVFDYVGNNKTPTSHSTFCEASHSLDQRDWCAVLHFKKHLVNLTCRSNFILIPLHCSQQWLFSILITKLLLECSWRCYFCSHSTAFWWVDRPIMYRVEVAEKIILSFRMFNGCCSFQIVSTWWNNLSLTCDALAMRCDLIWFISKP